MTSDFTKAQACEAEVLLFDSWFDPVEDALRARVRGFGARVHRGHDQDPMRVAGGWLWQAEVARTPSRRRPMSTTHSSQNKPASRTDPDTIFVSLELSRSRWLV